MDLVFGNDVKPHLGSESLGKIEWSTGGGDWPRGPKRNRYLRTGRDRAGRKKMQIPFQVPGFGSLRGLVPIFMKVP